MTRKNDPWMGSPFLHAGILAEKTPGMSDFNVRRRCRESQIRVPGSKNRSSTALAGMDVVIAAPVDMLDDTVKLRHRVARILAAFGRIAVGDVG